MYFCVNCNTYRFSLQQYKGISFLNIHPQVDLLLYTVFFLHLIQYLGIPQLCRLIRISSIAHL